MAISKKKRFEVFKRDGFICQYCGQHPPAVILEVDHIDPVANGGTNDIDNLITACFPCNRGKSDRLLTNVPESLKDKAKRIAEAEAQLLGYQQVLQSRDERIQRESWDIVYALRLSRVDSDGTDSVRRDFFLSIKRFVIRLGFYAVKDAADIAMAKSLSDYAKFKYFCGVCWKFIHEAADSGTQSGNKGPVK